MFSSCPGGSGIQRRNNQIRGAHDPVGRVARARSRGKGGEYDGHRLISRSEVTRIPSLSPLFREQPRQRIASAERRLSPSIAGLPRPSPFRAIKCPAT